MTYGKTRGKGPRRTPWLYRLPGPELGLLAGKQIAAAAAAVAVMVNCIELSMTQTTLVALVPWVSHHCPGASRMSSPVHHQAAGAQWVWTCGQMVPGESAWLCLPTSCGTGGGTSDPVPTHHTRIMGPRPPLRSRMKHKMCE